MGFIKLNGQSSKDLVDSQGIPIGLEVEHYPAFEMPERNYTVTHIPGRNGDGVFDPGDYKNVDREYEIAFGAVHPGFNYSRAAAAISKWLHNPTAMIQKFEPLTGYKGEIKAFLESIDDDYYIGDIRKDQMFDTYYKCIRDTHGYADPTAWQDYSGSLPVFFCNKGDILRMRNRDRDSSEVYTYIQWDGNISSDITIYDYLSPWIVVHPEITTFLAGTVVEYKGRIYSAKRTTTSLIWISDDWEENGNFGSGGYLRLEDSYEPDVYRLAIYKENTTLSNIFNRGGQAKIRFNCQPQRFLKSGETFFNKGYCRAIDSEITDKVLMLENPSENGYGPYSPVLKLTLYANLDDSGNILSSLYAGTTINIGKKTNNQYTTIWQIFMIEDMGAYIDDDHVAITFSLDCDTGKVFDISSFVDGNVKYQYPENKLLVSRDETLAVTAAPLVAPNDELYFWVNIVTPEGVDPYQSHSQVLKCEVKPRWWTI